MKASSGHTKAPRERESFAWWGGCRCAEAQRTQHKRTDILRYDCQWGFAERCPHLSAHLSRLSQKSETVSGGWAGTTRATAKWRNQMCFWRNFNRLWYSLCPQKEVILLAGNKSIIPLVSPWTGRAPPAWPGGSASTIACVQWEIGMGARARTLRCLHSLLTWAGTFCREMKRICV